MDTAIKRKLREKLLSWYRRHARDLPWRRTRDPYAIWVSEIMLQQTQVTTVIPYYEKWLRRFPAITDLAEAPQSVVLEAWAGLGYYRRARMLHAAAQQLAGDSPVKLPENAEALKKLPGIGRYTAAAIASIAFGEAVAVLDGNVMRILTRIFAIWDDISSPKTTSRLWDLAQDLIPAEAPGDFNQAMMELGATVCTPQNPGCGTCPVSNFCEAKKQDIVPELPFKGKKEKSEHLRTFALVFRKGSSVLLRRQPENGRWGGLWMFPHWPKKDEMLRESGLKPADLEKFMTVQHAFTKYRIRLEVYQRCGESGARKIPRSLINHSSAWIPLKALPQCGLPSPHQKIAQRLLGAKD